MAAAELRMPADIFEEMAGVKEIIPEQSSIAATNVNVETSKTPINETRLSLVSNSLFADVNKFEKYLVKLFRKISALQNENVGQGTDDAIKKAAKESANKALSKSIPLYILIWLKVAELIIDKWEELKAQFTEAIMGFVFGINLLFTVASKSIAWLFRKLGETIAWALTKITEFITWIWQKVWAVAETVFKKASEVLKWAYGRLWQCIKWVLKGVEKLAESLWNVFARLFFIKRDKRDDAYFLNQPKGMSFKKPTVKAGSVSFGPNEFEIIQPTDTVKQVQIVESKPDVYKDSDLLSGNKMKQTDNDLEFIGWYLLKKVFIKAAKFIENLVIKIFKPIITRTIRFVVRVITKFMIYLAVFSWMLFGAFAAATAATFGYIIANGGELLSFIKDRAMSIFDYDNDDDIYSTQTEESYNDNDDSDLRQNQQIIKPFSVTDWKNKLDEMEKQHMENSVEYNAVKAEYVAKLIEQAELTGNLEQSLRLRKALKLPETGNYNIYTVDSEALNNFNLKQHIKEESLIAAEKIKKYNEAAKEEVISKGEMEELLLAADGEPEWMMIVKRLVIGVKEKIVALFDKATYVETFEKVVNNIQKAAPLVYKFKTTWFAKKEEQTIKKIEKLKLYSHTGVFYWFLSTMNFVHHFLIDTFKNDNQYKLKDIAEDRKIVNDIFEEHKFSLKGGTDKFREVNDELNEQERMRFNKWLDILILLKTIQIQNS